MWTQMKQNLLTSDESFLFAEGTWLKYYDKMGAHLTNDDSGEGCTFAVWAPGAKSVHVTGSFNEWNPNEYAMLSDKKGEIWHLFVPGVHEGDLYKYVIETKEGELLYKADPCAFSAQKPPETASVVADIYGYQWKDGRWMSARRRYSHSERPLNIYEVHLGSWKRHEDGSYYTYAELEESLVPYVADMGYSHIELLPVMEHPFDGSWGYQVTGYYAPTSRYGTPKEFMHFIDTCHKAGIGVILDWVPGHFCRDAHGLGAFTGQKVYEKEDHAQWGTYKFDHGKGEVRSFLVSNAMYWIEMYHADGIRVDGVTSMLYLNFGIDDPRLKKFNEKGTEENFEAIDFIRKTNELIGQRYPDVMLMAEESTAWPLVTYPPSDGGLGYHYKWDMGWMNDTLRYMQTDFPFRKGNHKLLTFSMMYAFNENFILALSHDEVVHGKCSLIGRMPGDYWRQFAGVRLLALYQMTHPGGKLNFMGNEFAQFIEWRYYEGLEWFLPENYDTHRKHLEYIKALNGLYKSEKALWQYGYSWAGYEWLDADNNDQSIISFIRRGKLKKDDLVVLINFCPETYSEYRLGVPVKGVYKEIFNSDSIVFGGSGSHMNTEFIESEKVAWHGQKNSVTVKVPPIGGIILKRVGRKELEANNNPND